MGATSSPNVDINGNGLLDADEAWVQSVADRPSASVPADTPSNETVTLSDSVSDITTTGTVTFSNAQIDLNQATHSGTVVVTYDGGANGGTVTNCAHLTGSGQTQTVGSGSGSTLFPNILPVNLTACDTQVIGPRVCTPGAVGCGWTDGDVVTYSQSEWGEGPTAAGILLNNYFTALYGALGYVEVGIPGSGGFSMLFTSASAVFNYQPASGPASALNADLVDPTSTASGVFGGEVLALRFNIDFSNAGYLLGTSGIRLANLTLCNLSVAGLNGSSVQTFQGIANTALGGGATPYAISDLLKIAFIINLAFDAGVVNVFAQDHLFNGACPP